MGVLVIKLVIFLTILFVIGIVRVTSGVIKVVSNELPEWLEATKKILNEFSDNKEIFQFCRENFPERLENQMNEIAILIDKYSYTNLDTFQLLQFIVCVHMAKADGQISKTEIDGIREYFQEDFQEDFRDDLLAKASVLIKKHIQDYSTEELAVSAAFCMDSWFEVINSCYNTKNSKEDEEVENLAAHVFSTVYKVALIDGIEESEKKFFYRMCQHLNISNETIEFTIRFAEYLFNSEKYEKETTLKDDEKIKLGLKLFNLKENFTKEELTSSWKNFAKTNHPDRFHFLEKEEYNKINESFLKAKESYEFLLERAQTSKSSEKNSYTETNSSTEKNSYSEKASYTQSKEYSYKEDAGYQESQNSGYQKSYSKTKEYKETPEPEDTLMNVFSNFTSFLFSGLKKILPFLISIIKSEKLQNFLIKLKSSLSPSNIHKVFFGTTKRKLITLATPILLILGIFITPYLVDSYYKRLLSTDDSSKLEKVITYFKLQKFTAVPVLESHFKNAEDTLTKLNTLKVLLSLQGNSTNIERFITELLSKEDKIVLDLLETLADYSISEEKIIDELVLLFRRKDDFLKSQVVKILSKDSTKPISLKESNLKELITCSKDAKSEISEFCLTELSHYSEQEQVKNLALQYLNHISKDIQKIAIRILMKGMEGNSHLDEFYLKNKRHEFIKKLEDFSFQNEEEYIDLVVSNPIYFADHVNTVFRILLSTQNRDRLITKIISTDIRYKTLLERKMDVKDFTSTEETVATNSSIENRSNRTSSADERSNTTNSSYERNNTARISEASGLFLRDRCGKEGNKMILIPHNEIVEVLSKDKEDTLYDISSNWYRIKYKGKVGCSFGGFLKF
jgi:uncharacterized tellurite resistance protein B-like protein